MGADVMRWQYCAQPPDRNLLFGFGPAHEIQRKLLTLWNSAKFLVDYGNVARFEPVLGRPRGGSRRRAAAARPLARRARRAARRGGDGRVRALADRRRRARVRRVRRRPVELVHPSLAPPVLGGGHPGAAHALVRRRHGASGRSSPVMPFLTEHLWRVLVTWRRGRARLGVPRRLALAAGGRRVPRRGGRAGAPRRSSSATRRGRPRS